MNGPAEVHRLRTRLDATFSRVPGPSSDIEVQSDFAKYLCVLVSGFLENSIVALMLDFVERRSAPEITSHVERSLGYWTNPSAEKIKQLLGSFSTDWHRDLESYLVDERKDSVNSIVTLRHKIAHGESVGTSLSQVKAHYRTILEVLDHIADLLK
jgi:hypothetical protein